MGPVSECDCDADPDEVAIRDQRRAEARQCHIEICSEVRGRLIIGPDDSLGGNGLTGEAECELKG